MWFITASIAPSYLACVIAHLDEERLAPLVSGGIVSPRKETIQFSTL